MDVKLPKFKAYVNQVKSLSQVIDWANSYHESQKFTNQGEGAVIFIVDTAGTFQDHDDLRDNNKVYLNGNSTPDPDKDINGHGTHCGGISAAVDNSMGCIGIAPKALLGARKALGDNGSGAYSWIASEITKVADLKLKQEDAHRKKIISLSLGGSSPNSVLKRAIDYAIGKGCFIIAAAGNSGYRGEDTIGYPAKYPEVIAVGSIDKKSQPSYFSSGGDEIDFAAYGHNNYSTYKNNTYAILRGTSMATPVVSGLVALVLTEYPEIKNQAQLNKYLEDSALDIFTNGFDVRTGHGTLKTGLFKEPNLGDKPEPEPEPTPEPPKDEPKLNPIRSQIDLWIDETFNVMAKNANEDEYTLCKVKVAATADLTSEDDILKAMELTKRFFKNRGFWFASTSGIDRWADLIARFLYVVTKHWGIGVYASKIWIEKGDLKIVKSVSPRNSMLIQNTDEHKTFNMKTQELTAQIPVDKIGFERNENLGIDKIKEVLGDLFTSIDGLVDVFGGQLESGLLTLASVVGKYKYFKDSVRQAIEQFNDLSEEESKAVYAYVVENFDIEDDELEVKIERVLKIPITGFAEYLDSIELIEEVKDTWNSDATTFEKFKALFRLMSNSGFSQGEDIVALFIETIAALRALFTKKKV